VAEIAPAGVLPDAGEIGSALTCSRGGAEQVGLAVGRLRDVRRRKCRPLRGQRWREPSRESGHEDDYASRSPEHHAAILRRSVTKDAERTRLVFLRVLRLLYERKRAARSRRSLTLSSAWTRSMTAAVRRAP